MTSMLKDTVHVYHECEIVKLTICAVHIQAMIKGAIGVPSPVMILEALPVQFELCMSTK